MECNRQASEGSKLAITGDHQTVTEDVIQPPYEGSRAMIKINGKWITLNLKEHILYASHTPKVSKYYNKRFKWQDETFDTVYWTSIKRVRTKMQLHKSHQEIKIMCGWLPTNKMRGYITGIRGCPGCRCELKHSTMSCNAQMQSQ